MVEGTDGLRPQQREAYDQIAGGKRGAVRGPFKVLLHSPELARRVEQLGVYLRFDCVLSERIRELVIVVVARHYHSDVEWTTHAPRVAALGVSAAVLAAIGEGEAPPFDEESDRIAVQFAGEVLAGEGGRPVSEAIMQDAIGAFGVEGTVELTGLVGYYTLLALVLNTFQVPPGYDYPIPWRAAAAS
jgi:4-carboxymuconolactone decarboxylase